jgi:hypothetical protein
MNETGACNDYSGEHVMNETELMIYELSGGDISKFAEIKRLPLKTVYGFLYQNRVTQLNRISVLQKKTN